MNCNILVHISSEKSNGIMPHDDALAIGWNVNDYLILKSSMTRTMNR